MIKSGFVLIVGKPNSGKSTLLNTLLGKKVAIATPRRNTTRNKIRGIYNDKDSQIIFIDTPGFLNVKTKLDEKMHETIVHSFNDADLILYLLPFWKEIDRDYLKKIEFNKKQSKKNFLILTKVDLEKDKLKILEKINSLRDNELFDEIIPISSFKKENIDVLLNEIKKCLKEDHLLYPKDQIHEMDDRFYIAEIIREKILISYNYEVPHSVYINVKEFKKKNNLLLITADIVVSKESMRPIILGEGGKKIKQIGIMARMTLEKHYNKKIFLELSVKVKKNWQEKDSIIKDL